MTMEQPTRLEVLKGMAAASLVPTKMQSETASSPLCFTSAVEMAQLIREKKLSAREALAEHLKQIERVNPKVNAIVTLVPEMAAEDAAKADEMQAHNETLGPIATVQGLCSEGRRPGCGTDAAGRRNHYRQDEHAGVWSGIADV